jgi:peptide methionine sulfoxide reductase MsrB
MSKKKEKEIISERSIREERVNREQNAAKVFWPTLYKPVRTENVTSKAIAAVGFARSHVVCYKRAKTHITLTLQNNRGNAFAC